MAIELIYTSAERGLKPRSYGFCTVAMTHGMGVNVVDRLEGLSGYRMHYPANDPNAHLNPVNYTYYRFTMGGRVYPVLSRVSFSGFDYTGRSNKLAHHLVLDEDEQSDDGPAWLAMQKQQFVSEWSGDPQLIPSPRRLQCPQRPAGAARTWQQLTGDAGWAGVVAEHTLADPQNTVVVQYKPEQGSDSILAMLDEAMALIPPAKRWEITYSTYLTDLPTNSSCRWRFVVPDAAEWTRNRRQNSILRIDLTASSFGQAQGGELVEAARSGKVPHRAAPTNRSLRTPSAAPTTAALADTGAYDVQATPRDWSLDQLPAAPLSRAPAARRNRRSVVLAVAAAFVLSGIAATAIALKFNGSGANLAVPSEPQQESPPTTTHPTAPVNAPVSRAVLSAIVDKLSKHRDAAKFGVFTVGEELTDDDVPQRHRESLRISWTTNSPGLVQVKPETSDKSACIVNIERKASGKNVSLKLQVSAPGHEAMERDVSISVANAAPRIDADGIHRDLAAQKFVPGQQVNIQPPKITDEDGPDEAVTGSWEVVGVSGSATPYVAGETFGFRIPEGQKQVTVQLTAKDGDKVANWKVDLPVTAKPNDPPPPSKQASTPTEPAKAEELKILSTTDITYRSTKNPGSILKLWVAQQGESKSPVAGRLEVFDDLEKHKESKLVVTVEGPSASFASVYKISVSREKNELVVLRRNDGTLSNETIAKISMSSKPTLDIIDFSNPDPVPIVLISDYKLVIRERDKRIAQISFLNRKDFADMLEKKRGEVDKLKAVYDKSLDEWQAADAEYKRRAENYDKDMKDWGAKVQELQQKIRDPGKLTDARKALDESNPGKLMQLANEKAEKLQKDRDLAHGPWSRADADLKRMQALSEEANKEYEAARKKLSN